MPVLATVDPVSANDSNLNLNLDMDINLEVVAVNAGGVEDITSSAQFAPLMAEVYTLA